MPNTERPLWAAANNLYEAARVNMDMESARAVVVSQLQFMARSIEERLLSPKGELLSDQKADEIEALIDDGDEK